VVVNVCWKIEIEKRKFEFPLRKIDIHGWSCQFPNKINVLFDG